MAKKKERDGPVSLCLSLTLSLFKWVLLIVWNMGNIVERKVKTHLALCLSFLAFVYFPLLTMKGELSMDLKIDLLLIS